MHRCPIPVLPTDAPDDDRAADAIPVSSRPNAAPDAVVSLQTKLDALLLARTYPADPGTVDVIETHMSWVFRTSRHVYKLKKPVRFPGLDFRTAAARMRYCAEEVRLNRRLAGSVYLEAVALVVDDQGELKLEAPGRVVEWLVKMQRLPEDRTLERLLEAGCADSPAIAGIGRKLAQFYASQRPVKLNPERRYRATLNDIQVSWKTLARARYRLPAAAHAKAAEVCMELACRLQGSIEARAGSGRLIEGHGDLRPEHVFMLEPEPIIIDCLEFNRGLRILDPVDDLGFLSLECERLGHGWAHSVLFDVYSQITGDRPPEALIHFHQSHRAAVRARLAILHLNEARFHGSDKWRAKALCYIALAQSHALKGLQAGQAPMTI